MMKEYKRIFVIVLDSLGEYLSFYLHIASFLDSW